MKMQQCGCASVCTPVAAARLVVLLLACLLLSGVGCFGHPRRRSVACFCFDVLIDVRADCFMVYCRENVTTGLALLLRAAASSLLCAQNVLDGTLTLAYCDLHM
jgi:hypothetical protein